METSEAILKRRSVRKYLSKPIKKEDLNAILCAGFASPSACNKKPWQVLVIDNKDILNDLAKIYEAPGRMLKECPLAIIILADKNLSMGDYAFVDCSLMAENMMLMATSLHIGCCYLGTYPRKVRMDDLSKYFNLPPHLIPHSSIVFGYSENPEKDFYQKTSIEVDKLHFNKYETK